MIAKVVLKEQASFDACTVPLLTAKIPVTSNLMVFLAMLLNLKGAVIPHQHADDWNKTDATRHRLPYSFQLFLTLPSCLFSWEELVAFVTATIFVHCVNLGP